MSLVLVWKSVIAWEELPVEKEKKFQVSVLQLLQYERSGCLNVPAGRFSDAAIGDSSNVKICILLQSVSKWPYESDDKVVLPRGRFAVTSSAVFSKVSIDKRSPAAIRIVLAGALISSPPVVTWAEHEAGAISPICSAIQSPLTNKRLGILVHEATLPSRR